MNIIDIEGLSELPLSVIHVKGSSEERGYQFGKQVKELIAKAILIYKEIVFSLRPDSLTWEGIVEDVKIRRYDKELYIEMKAMAKGAEVSLEEILFLNVRSEIMNPAWAKTISPEGCTSFLVQPCATRNEEYFIGQTYDWFPTCKELLVVLHSEDEKYITVTEAGILAKIGCNNRGVGNLLNYLNNYEINRNGAPYNILLRRVLNSESFIDAQRNIIRSPIAFGLNIFIADSKGSGINYELAANGIDFFHPENGILVHSNHHLSNKLSLRTFNKKMYPNSQNRYDVAKKILSEKGIELSDLISLVSYHDEENNDSICRHEKDDEQNVETIFTMIIELTQMVLYLCFDTPCNNNFYKIELQKVFKNMKLI